METKKRALLIPVLCLLCVLMFGILNYFKEEPVFDVTLPTRNCNAEGSLEDPFFGWIQEPGQHTYYMRIENTGEASVDAHVKSRFPFPGYILTIGPGETWELAVENAHPATHTITFKSKGGNPSGTVEVWSITQ